MSCELADAAAGHAECGVNGVVSAWLMIGWKKIV